MTGSSDGGGGVGGSLMAGAWGGGGLTGVIGLSSFIMLGSDVKASMSEPSFSDPLRFMSRIFVDFLFFCLVDVLLPENKKNYHKLLMRNETSTSKEMSDL